MCSTCVSTCLCGSNFLTETLPFFGIALYFFIFSSTKTKSIMEQHQNTSLFSLNLDAQNSYTLRSMASWSKVLGVVGMVLGVLFILVGILVQQAISRYGNGYYRSGGLSASSIGNMGMAVYVLLGLIMIVTSIFALNAGNKINAALRANDQAALSAGFANARNYFAFWAILIIILLLLLLVSILSGLGA